MDLFRIEKINVRHVRHLKNLNLDLAAGDHRLHHLIITGKNGSGKTSFLAAIGAYLHSISSSDSFWLKEQRYFENLQLSENHVSAHGFPRDTDNAYDTNGSNDANDWAQERVRNFETASGGLSLSFSMDKKDIRAAFEQGKFVLASFSASRCLNSPKPRYVEKTVFKDCWSIRDNAGSRFYAYLLDMKMTHALAVAKNDEAKARKIQQWFDTMQAVLRDLYDDPSLRLDFDDETFWFTLAVAGGEPFELNSASAGFSAVLEIICELLVRMQHQSLPVSKFLLPGIALIDEIESHHHIALQKRILAVLCRVFPNIQFIVTTNSPFVLGSVPNAVIYDLDAHRLLDRGLSKASFSGIVEGYFKQDELSADLRQRLDEYRKLTGKRRRDLSDCNYGRMALLEASFEKIPDYVDVAVAAEFHKLKFEFDSRND
ncbi:MAG: AAA family ATPase [Succinivibrionaceae bacterium]|nr:AAA family ATPase [Succinivibrionaceae bacterium]